MTVFGEPTSPRMNGQRQINSAAPQDREESPYRAADGATVVTVVRTETLDGKRIRRAPAGVKAPPGGYPLYRLPSLIANPDKPLLVVEGEKTAETAHYLFGDRYELTTAIGGAGKARQSDWSPARDREVVIWPDADEPGRAHAKDVARLCHESGAKTVRIVDTKGLRAGWDLADPLDGLDIERLVEEAKCCSAVLDQGTENGNSISGALGLGGISMHSLLNASEEVIRWVVYDMFPAGGFSIMTAAPKVGKSTLARVCAVAVAQGRPDFLGREVKQGPVIYVALEEKRGEVARHFRAMGATESDPITTYIGYAPPDALERLAYDVEHIKPVLVIIDPLFRLVRVENTSDYAEITKALEPLLVLARESGAHVLCTHHSRKGGGEQGEETLGSTAIYGSVDTLLSLKRTDAYRTIYSGQRYGVDMPESVLAMDDDGWISLAGTRESADDAKLGNDILAFIRSQTEAVDQKTIREECQCSKARMARVLRALLDQGQITQYGSGRKGDPLKYVSVPASDS